MTEAELAMYRTEMRKQLEQEMAKAPKPDPLHVPITDFLIRLSMKRFQEHLTQADLAMRTGMKQSAISRIESGKGNPSLRTLLIILNALDTELVLQSVKLEIDKEGTSQWKRH